MKTNPKLYFTTAFFAAALFLGGCKTDDFSQVQEDVAAAAAEEEEAYSESEANARTSSSQTAQSAMVGISYDAPVIEGEITWTFDVDEAMKYFTGGTETQRRNLARDQKCTFLNGGLLYEETYPGPRNTTVTVKPVDTQEYPKNVSAPTAWSSKQTGSTVSNTTIDIILASESVVVNKGKEKYSFSLASNSITDLKVEVTGQALREQNIDFLVTVLTDDNEGTCLAGFKYVASGNNKFGKAVSYLKDGFMGDIIASNKFGSTEACGNTAIGVVDRLTYQLPVGTYTVKVSGTIKGNGVETALETPFTVTDDIVVGGIGNCPKPQQL